MNTSKLLSSALIAVASLSAASAFADNNNYPEISVQGSSLSRAQVRAELVQAQRDGTLIKSDDAYPSTVATQAGSKTRDEVKAELRAAQHEGLSQRIDNTYPSDVAQGSAGLNSRS